MFVSYFCIRWQRFSALGIPSAKSPFSKFLRSNVTLARHGKSLQQKTAPASKDFSVRVQHTAGDDGRKKSRPTFSTNRRPARRPIYMDYQATTPVDKRVLEEMLPYFTERFGNASSSGHMYGWEAQFAVEKARGIIGDSIGALEHRDIIFTSGATEANNLAIKGVVEAYHGEERSRVVTVCTEHSAVLGPVEYLRSLSVPVTILPVTPTGHVHLGGLESALGADVLLVSVMAANNETGVLHSLAEIGALCRKHGALFHTDAAQALGKIPLDVESMSIDLMSLSAHKVYGPKGIGALYVRGRAPAVRIAPQLHGGGHELDRRSGTLSTPLIAGFGKAVELAMHDLNAGGEPARLHELKLRLWRGLDSLGGTHMNGTLDQSLPSCLNVSFEGVDGAQLLKRMQQVASVSSGSACSSEDNGAVSHVLTALGRSRQLASASIRFGIGRFTTPADIDAVLEALCTLVPELRSAALA